MNFSRKRANIKEAQVLKKEATKVEIIVNNRPLSYYETKCLEFKPLNEVINYLKNGCYRIVTKGGGLGSLKEVVTKRLFLELDEELKNKIKKEYPYLTKTDIRKVQPKKAGGKKARARIQKSYR